MTTNKSYTADLPNLLDKKILYELAKEMYFDIKALGNKNTREKISVRLPQSPSIMASSFSSIFLSEKANEHYDRIKLLLQQKQAGNNSKLINEEIVVVADKLLQHNWHNWICTKQHKCLLVKCSN